MDLSGKLIIKAQLGEDIRRIPIHNEDITYDELMLMMQRVYRGKLKNSDDITLKYKDEDNDLITIFDDSDLSFAIQCSRILKITLFVNGQPQPLESNQIKHLKTELRQIRDRVIQIIDTLEPQSDISSSVDTVSKEEPMVTESTRQATQPTQTRPTNSAQGKEFDPLSSQKVTEEKVMSSFGISSQSERPGTPDSINSVGSASSTNQRQQQSTPSTPQHMPPPQQPVAQPPSQQPIQGFQPVQPQQQTQQHPGQPGFPQQQQMYSGQPDQRQQIPGQQQQQGYGVPGQPPTSQPQRFPTPQQPHAQPVPGQPGYQGQPQQNPQQPNPQQQQYGQFYGQQNPQQQQQQTPQHQQQQVPQVSQAPWNQQQQPQQPQAVYQGYAGQPQAQPGAMPGGSPSGTPGTASPNPYSRGPGSGYGGGYPKPSQGYPTTPQGYK
ncbi:uncharacterized protein LOC143048695 isoform X3 [Mytilus galloprovincialis]|uniref:Protein TFG n=1 Tax=Mytilus galloprovincialis TaxID=29158 RepID=A0A8B6E4Q6_MYTGA|nr:protein TFG [Mytilus galloprovincialis]